jgi:uncharacterized protein YutE (UPF0331/DUF86 family)
MSKEAYNKIKTKLQRLDEYLEYLKELRKASQARFLADHHIYGLAERYLQLSVQIVIDVGQMLIVAKNLRRPENNQDIFVILGGKKKISKSLEERLTGIANFRNILVHDYEKLDHKKVYNHLQASLKDFTDFKKQILKSLR